MTNKLIFKFSLMVGGLVLLMLISQAAALALVASGLVVLGIFGLRYTGLLFRSVEADIRQKEAAANFQAVSSPHGVLSMHNNRLQFWTRESAQPSLGDPHRGSGPGMPEAWPEAHPPLLPVLTSIDRALIVAGMGSGKSELLKWIALDASETRGGDVFIVDSHASPDTWPIGGINVVGIGRDYEQIEATVNWICSEMDSRYKQRSSGEKKRFHPITLIIDELTVLHQFTDLQQQFKSLLCECRKVNIRLFFAGQSDRAASLGLSGNKDLTAGFEAVVYLRKENGAYLGDVFTGSSKQAETFLHPGVFGCLNSRAYRDCHTGENKPPDGVRAYDRSDMNDTRNNTTGNHPGADHREGVHRIPFFPDHEPYAQYKKPGPDRIFESALERDIVTGFEAGASFSKLAKTHFNYSNGNTIKRVKATLSKHGVL